jgi:hypothetical protein
MSTFLKNVQINEAGYLVTTDGIPVINYIFVAQQKYAHELILLSRAIEGKKFKSEPIDDFEKIKNEVIDFLSKDDVEYFSKTTPPISPLTNSLKLEALAFIKYNEEEEINKKVNEIMQRFNVIYDYEKFGLYFTNDVTRFHSSQKRLYTIDEIIKAVRVLIDLI